MVRVSFVTRRRWKSVTALVLTDTCCVNRRPQVHRPRADGRHAFRSEPFGGPSRVFEVCGVLRNRSFAFEKRALMANEVCEARDRSTFFSELNNANWSGRPPVRGTPLLKI